MWTSILPWIFTHNNWTCKHPYWTNLLQWYTLVNALYKITTKSINLLMFGQFGTSSNLIVPTRSVQKATFFFFFYTFLLRISWILQKCHWEFFSLEFTMKSEIIASTLLALPATQVLVWQLKFQSSFVMHLYFLW